MGAAQVSSCPYILTSLCSLSQAWPLLINNNNNNNNHERRNPAPRPQSYSVVAVDGGSTGQPVTQTITNAQTQTQTALVTMLSTITVDGVEQATTPYLPTTIVQEVSVTSVVTVSMPQETTTMVVAPSVTSKPFDNGQWHTTYYYESTLSTMVPAEAPSSSVSASAPVWGAWSEGPSLEVAPTTASTIASSTSSSTTAVWSNEAWTSVTSSAASSPSPTIWATYYGVWR